jgi:hypothetical protein
LEPSPESCPKIIKIGKLAFNRGLKIVLKHQGKPIVENAGLKKRLIVFYLLVGAVFPDQVINKIFLLLFIVFMGTGHGPINIAAIESCFHKGNGRA